VGHQARHRYQRSPFTCAGQRPAHASGLRRSLGAHRCRARIVRTAAQCCVTILLSTQQPVPRPTGGDVIFAWKIVMLPFSTFVFFMSLFLFLSCSSFFVLTLASSCSQAPPLGFDQLFSEGMARFQAGDIAPAIEAFEAALQTASPSSTKSSLQVEDDTHACAEV